MANSWLEQYSIYNLFFKVSYKTYWVSTYTVCSYERKYVRTYFLKLHFQEERFCDFFFPGANLCFFSLATQKLFSFFSLN